jgi:hypothetical protein
MIEKYAKMVRSLSSKAEFDPLRIPPPEEKSLP